jgi:hypothetical protein
MGVYVSSVIILAGAGRGGVISWGMLTGLRSCRGVGVSSVLSNMESRESRESGSEFCFGDGGGYTLRGLSEVVDSGLGCRGGP